MRIIVVAGWAPSLVNFRGPLLREMVERGHEVIAVAPEPSITIGGRLKDMGVKYRTVPFSRAAVSPIADLLLIVRLCKLFLSHRPDIIFCYTTKPVIYGMIAARIVGLTRRTAMITGLGYAFGGAAKSQGWLESTLKRLYKGALHHAETVFFQNPDDRDLFYKLNLVRRDQIEIVNGSGVDTMHFMTAPFTPGPPVFLLIARLLVPKGILEFVDAAREVKKRFPEAVFRVLGYFDHDGNPESILPSQVEAWEDEGVISFLGHAEDVRPHLAASDVFVLPSYREGTPRTVLEAMSTGRAIVTTDAPGCRETVIPGVNGYLVPVQDHFALAEAMQAFIEQPELISLMGRESRRIAEDKYDVHKVNRRILNRLGL